jgi:hypothetical protein
MPKRTFEPCIPTRGTAVPAGPDWIHEIKHDGYRLIVRRDGKRVRLFTRNGHDWTDRYSLIVEAALRNRATSFVIDGEAVLLGVDGLSDFDGLHSRQHDDDATRCLRRPDAGRRRPSQAAAVDAQDQPRPATGATGRRASSFPISSKARSGRTCFARPASSGSRGSSQSIAIAPTGRAGRRTGSR